MRGGWPWVVVPPLFGTRRMGEDYRDKDGEWNNEEEYEDKCSYTALRMTLKHADI